MIAEIRAILQSMRINKAICQDGIFIPHKAPNTETHHLFRWKSLKEPAIEAIRTELKAGLKPGDHPCIGGYDIHVGPRTYRNRHGRTKSVIGIAINDPALFLKYGFHPGTRRVMETPRKTVGNRRQV